MPLKLLVRVSSPARAWGRGHSDPESRGGCARSTRSRAQSPQGRTPGAKRRGVGRALSRLSPRASHFQGGRTSARDTQAWPALGPSPARSGSRTHPRREGRRPPEGAWGRVWKRLWGVRIGIGQQAPALPWERRAHLVLPGDDLALTGGGAKQSLCPARGRPDGPASPPRDGAAFGFN